MNAFRPRIAAAIAAASILLGFGSTAHAREEVQQCRTETGDFYVLGLGKGGRAAHCKRKESCLVKIIEGRCQEFFGCKLEWRLSYSQCDSSATTAPPTKVQPKMTPDKAETAKPKAAR